MAWALGTAGVDTAMLALAAIAVVIGGSAAGVASPPFTATVSFVVLCLTLYWSRGLYRLRFSCTCSMIFARSSSQRPSRR